MYRRHIHSMPKHTPRQFYNTKNTSGMLLRSGKTINCIRTTELGKDYEDLIRIFNMCKHALDRCGESTSITHQWIKFYPEEMGWNREHAFLNKMNKGMQYSVGCTINFTLNNFLKKWRKTVNEVSDIGIRASLMENLENSIAELDDRLTWPYWPDYCACHDPHTQVTQEAHMDHFRAFGPGYLEDGLWRFTPSVTSAEFEAQWHENKKTWSHSLPELKDSLTNHLKYFKRIPHRNYQSAYFAISSNKVPQPCSLNIISFL